MTKLVGAVALVALGVGGTLGLSSAAGAGDLGVPVPAYKAPAPPMRPYTWEGFYIGANAGGYWGSDKITTATDTGWTDPVAAPAGAAGAAAIDAASPTKLHPSGGIGGLQIGYNLQGPSGNVFGIEADADWLSGTARRTLSNIPVIDPRDVMTNTMQATFLSTVRLRWGTTMLSERSLLFLTAGFAFATLKTTDSMGHFGNTVITTASDTATEPGLAGGLGFAYAFTDYLSARGEYLYANIKTSIVTIVPSSAANTDSITVNHAFSEHIVRAGLDLKLWSH